MVNYVRLEATATRLINRNGRDITFQGFDRAPDDPLRPWRGPASSAPASTFATRGAFVPPNTVRQFRLTALGEGTDFDDLVRFSEQVIIVTYNGNRTVDLRAFDQVLDRTTTWGIVGLQVLRPADIQMIAYVGVRQ